jgi:hypothetical protein
VVPTPQTVTAWVAAYDAIVQSGPATTEEAKWRIARRAYKLFQLACSLEHGDKITRLFDNCAGDENPPG